MSINATDSHFLQCKKYKENSLGTVAYYLLEAIPKNGGSTITISVKPTDFASVTSLKKVLLNHCILYSATKREHDKFLEQLFEDRPQAT